MRRSRARLKIKFFDKAWRMQNMYKIRKEDRTLGKLVFNAVQKAIHALAKKFKFRGIRAIKLKGRKMGVSTYWLIFYLDDTLTHANTTSGIIAHTQKDVQKLFKIVKLAYRTCPEQVELPDGRLWTKPRASFDNVNELRFDDINSGIYVAIEARGETNNNLHISEAAFIKDDDRIKATLASVPNRKFGSNITVESTGNGMGGWFQETFAEAEGGNNFYDPFFFAWYQDPKHSNEAPADFEPNEVERLMRASVRERCGVELSDDQLFWWRMTKQEQGRLMPQEFPTFSEEAFLMSGVLAFDQDRVNAIVVKIPLYKRRITVKAQDAEGKPTTKVFEVNVWHDPKLGRRYVVAGDPAEGVGGDATAVEVLDSLTLEQVAEFVSDRIKPAETALLVDNLARYYNNAVAVIEKNNHGGTVIDRLKDIYSNIFCRLILDEKTNRKTKKLGWETNMHTRDNILDELDQILLDCSIKINSAILKAELQTFIINEDGKREAKSGKHDDTIIATAIALKVARLPRTAFALFKVS